MWDKKANLSQFFLIVFFSILLVGKLLTLKSAEDVSGHSLLSPWKAAYTDDAKIFFSGLAFYNKWNKFRLKNLAEISSRELFVVNLSSVKL